MPSVQIGTPEFHIIVADDDAKLSTVVKAARDLLNEVAPDYDESHKERISLRHKDQPSIVEPSTLLGIPRGAHQHDQGAADVPRL